MIDKLIITAFLLLICTAVTVQSIFLLVPFARRLEYDAICHDYIMRMEHQGGLSPSQQQALTDQLISRGFTIQRMDICTEGNYGESMQFIIQTSWQGRRLSGWLHNRKVEYQMTCSRNLLCRVPEINE